ncbi:circularly permuted type 2 ATP-grasp protein [Vibrio plantisponsor]|uniref:Circularly permuted type 2 ATP-grasp protein n=1 Tax=Vibrio plantisponsor TaxID=664643 RepID=A0ABU4IFB8_9VIBR|nr:circularly permuted type 2 ATP-grasp protein [Vibrio plantisponsor]MDW6017262.1 circularly permuted type 2 ATP-grasp protein [Vibrio plantisponsor]
MQQSRPDQSTNSTEQGSMETSVLVSPYPASSYAFDEVYDEQRVPRAHWKPLLEHLNKLDVDGLDDRHQRAQRILRDDGATYDLKNDPLTPDVWALDVIPNLIHWQEWQKLEKGLVQRSNLYDLILKDIYGEQNLIKDGIIPSEIIFSHPGFLRACHGIKMPGDKQLILHSVDLVRDTQGNHIVIGDHTQAPSGVGYALENRTVISRVMPSIFRQGNVRRLSAFFHTLRNTLSHLASHKSDSPLIVVLTPGAYSSTYFEHAYLANYLGYPLVQGGDLTVRNGKVWLKSLNGLSQVDVILRRLDDAYCDQAELNADSLLGVPGLLEVARAGNVILANPLGGGVLEAPALYAFLPKICQYLLGEQLLIPTVNTWWCGDKQSLSYIKENLGQLIIKPACRSMGQPTIYGHCLSEEDRVKTLAMIEKRPYMYVAQSYVPGSMLPIWSEQHIQARPSLLKAFTVADKDHYTVMPGGLTRVAESTEDYIVTKLSGSRSKDTWILSNSPDLSHQSLFDKSLDVAQQTSMPSRVVENLFWFGRYAERAEISLRLMRTVFKQLNGLESLVPESRDILLEAISHQTHCLPGFTTGDAALFENPNKELADLVTNGNRVGSIKANLQSLLACGEQVKEMLSADTRVILNELRDHIAKVDRAYEFGLPAIPEESLDGLVTTLLALSGLNHESMLRGQDWVFQQIGRRTERALQTANLLQSTLTKPLVGLAQQQVLESVLLSMEALISFRRRYRTRARVAFGLDLLMVDTTNPRALVYQLERLREFLNVLPRHQNYIPGGLTQESRLIIQTLTDIQLTDLEELAQIDDETETRLQLSQLMAKVTEQLEKFTSLISDKYFDHTAGPQQLIKPKWKLDV